MKCFTVIDVKNDATIQIVLDEANEANGPVNPYIFIIFPHFTCSFIVCSIMQKLLQTFTVMGLTKLFVILPKYFQKNQKMSSPMNGNL